MNFRLWWLAAALLNVPISVSAQSCAVQAPSNGTLGTCPSSISSGSTCQFSCNTGYTLTGSATYCSYGQLTAQTCVSSSSGAQLLQISVSGTIASITQFPGTGPVTVAGIAPGDQFNWTGIINTSIPSYPFAGYADWTTSDAILSESFTVGGFTWSSGSSSPLPPYMATACCGMFGVDLVDFYANQPGQGPSIQTSVGTLAANNWSIQLSAPTGTLATAATPNQTALERFSANSMNFQFGIDCQQDGFYKDEGLASFDKQRV
jgi:hypothetical protein